MTAEFWAFVAEREAMLRRKKVGHAAPFTNDMRLRHYWFSNIRRRDDPTFQWWQEQCKDFIGDDEALIRYTIAYYLFMWPKTFERVLPLLKKFGWDSPSVLIALGGQKKLFNPRHTTKLPSNLATVCKIMDRLPSVLPYMVGSDIQGTTAYLANNVYGLGPVLAFEVAYARHFALGGEKPHWAAPTPAAIGGAAIVLERELSVHQEAAQQLTVGLMHDLMAEHGEDFSWGVPDAQRALELFYVYARPKRPGRRYRW